MRACARSLQCSHFNRVLAGPSLRRREDQLPGYAEAEVMSQAAPLPLAARAHADMAGLKNCAKERSHRSLRPARAICGIATCARVPARSDWAFPTGATSELGHSRHDVGRGKTYAADPERSSAGEVCCTAEASFGVLAMMFTRHRFSLVCRS